MKLIIQIPCYNEEKNLPATFLDLPKTIEGIERIETLIIDDGSEDHTVEIASRIGVDHILSFKNHKGLARAFSEGIDKSLELGADIIVNTDADNQYPGQDIPQLVQPILEGKADVVVGARHIEAIPHFSWFKKKLLRWGSAVIRALSRTKVEDAVSGFRAFSKEAALRISILSDYSYTIENLIQLGHQKLKIVSVPIRTNPKSRESRLIKSIPHFVGQQAATIMRVYATYKALKVFMTLGLIIILPGLLGFIRFLYFYWTGRGQGHVQSLVFSAAMLLGGLLILIFGIIADLIDNNRKQIEKALYRIKKMELEKAERTKDED
ncbi:MAG: glycosyltransferase family 2 protein [Candidatus Aminicenantes bacterium]|nr:glycosyltransferase family 2 protein [Candidatus Aminicenantes bacterium]